MNVKLVGPDSSLHTGSLRSSLSQRLARSDLCFRKMTLAARQSVDRKGWEEPED